MSRTFLFKPHVVSASLAAVFAPCLALATPVVYGSLSNGQITIDASYKLPASSASETSATDAMPPSNTALTGGDLYASPGGTGGSLFYHTYGFADTVSYFGARASGNGSDFWGQTGVRFSQTFTNNSGMAQEFVFSFHVDYGEVNVSGTGAGMADLMLSVKKDGSTVARDRTIITQDAGSNRSCATDDAGSSALSSYFSCNGNYAQGGAAQDFVVSMGIIGAGDEFRLDYDIVGIVSGAFASGGGGYDCEIATLAAAEGVNSLACGGGGYSIARSGDPFGAEGLYGDPSNFRVAAALAVPEPDSLALLGAAGLGLGLVSRRRRRV